MTKFLNISTDRTLGGSTPSDSTVSSQKAIKNYIADNVPMNTATGTDGVSLFGTSASGNYATNIGYSSSSGTEGVALGYSASAKTTSVSIGSRSGNDSNKVNFVCVGYQATVGESDTVSIGYTSLANSQYGIAIGDTAYVLANSTGSIAIGYSTSIESQNAVAIGYDASVSGYGYGAVAIGYSASATGVGSIQLGHGTNTENQSLYVGFGAANEQYAVNYKLLGSTGIIPIERLGGDNTSTADKFLKENGSWSTIPGGWTPPSQTGNAGKFLTTDGTDTSWGIPKSFNLFDSKWSDYILNDQNWLRADTFSWQSGDVYVAAYNHLVADYQGGTSQTETVGSYTITYVLSTDGHKITTDETTVQNIYAESGVAWYYILDTTNTRFKLPRTKWGFIGLRDTVGTYVPESLPNIKGAADVAQGAGYDYRAEGAFAKVGGSGGNWDTGANCRLDFNASRSSSAYQDNAPVQQRSTQMYLYFYVGQYSQAATEQTAGLNAELFNGKADIDLDNLSATGKSAITALVIPDYSSAITNISFPYTAPSPGIVKLTFVAGNASWAKVNDISPAGRAGSRLSGNWIVQDLFVKTGDIVSIGGGSVTQSECCFIPLKGAVNA